MKWTIEQAQESDVPEIASIAHYYDINCLTPEQRQKRGFLVSHYSHEDYKQFLVKSDYFFVAKHENSIIGYLLAFSRNFIPASDWVGMQLRHRIQAAFILSKQMATRSDCSGISVGSSLYQNLFDHYSDIPVFAAIVLEPRNEPSVRFHKWMGFKIFWEVTPPDGISRGIWCREPD